MIRQVGNGATTITITPRSHNDTVWQRIETRQFNYVRANMYLLGIHLRPPFFSYLKFGDTIDTRGEWHSFLLSFRWNKSRREMKDKTTKAIYRTQR